MRLSPQRGQAMVLMLLTMLLLVLMVCMTLGISSRAKERQNLQALADAAALSNATATARTYNSAAMLNRVMVAHYAAMAAIQAEAAWVTAPMRIFDTGAGLVREFDIPDPSAACPPISHPGPPTFDECPDYWRVNNSVTCRSALLRPASYELWHAALSNYHPNPAYPGDSVNGKCADGVPNASAGCTAPRGFLGPKGFPELDLEVADQQRAIHEAIYDLARIQSKTFARLSNDVQSGALTKTIIEREEGRNGWGLFQSKANALAFQELNLATDVNQPHSAPYLDTMGQAVMGARIASLALEHDRDQFTRRTMQLLQGVRANLSSMPGNWDFKLYTAGAQQPDVRGMVSPSANNTQTNDKENKGFDPTMKVVYGDITAYLQVSWTLPCGPGAGTRKTTAPREVRASVGAYENGATHFMHDGTIHRNPSGTTWNACHLNHAHYNEMDENIHNLNHALLPDAALGYVFPTTSQKGARGIWGMPKMPVVLTERSPAQKSPWELDFNFKLNNGTGGTRLDLKDGIASELPKLGAYSAGVAYYHRRGHVGEPPNMLNPFWRATLVPAEIDEHRRPGGDLSPGTGATTRDTAASTGPLRYDPMARDAYRKIRAVLKPLEGPG